MDVEFDLAGCFTLFVSSDETVDTGVLQLGLFDLETIRRCRSVGFDADPLPRRQLHSILRPWVNIGIKVKLQHPIES